MSLEELRKEFPLVHFEKVDHCVIPRSEDASYPFGLPKPKRIRGEFIRMVNPMGGADTVRAENVEEIRWLAAWHQARAEANGFGA